MFVIHMLPAAQGDCLWVEYGWERRPHRILIDTGTPGTYQALTERIDALPARQRRFELFIVSHIDTDHIGAAPQFLETLPAGVEFGDVWFNGYRHLLQARGDDRLGVPHADELTSALVHGKVPWNEAFERGPVMIGADGTPPVRTLPGRMKITVLSPYHQHLVALEPEWTQALEKLRKQQAEREKPKPADMLGGRIDVDALASTPFREDMAGPNGSSIAVLLEYDRQRVLLAADAFPSVIERSVDRLLAGSGESRLRVAAYKVCHHGSRRNTSIALSMKLPARQYLISTNGAGTRHPNPHAVARLIQGAEPDATLVFNYRTEYNDMWDDVRLKKKHRFTTKYPPTGSSGLSLSIA